VRRSLAVLVLLVVLAGCGSKEDVTTPAGTQRVRLVLDYVPNADHAGIYAAIREGDFRRAGLDVQPVVPSDPAAPLKLLASGKADVVVSYEPELLLARDKGLDAVAIGALVQQPLTSIMSVGKRGITDVGRLEGKKVGTAGIPYQSAYLKTVAEQAGIDPGKVKDINVGFNLVGAMLSHRVDATLGAFWNVEGVQLARAHRDPHIIRIEKAGVPTYNELVLVARGSDLRSHGELYRTFLQALARGQRAVQRDPQTGVDALLDADKDLKRGDTAASVRATVPTFFPADRTKPFGYMDPRQWRAYSAWMARNKLLKRPATPRALTNEFLPGEGLSEPG
jgi:putative hydroxymethylpyrimidine transport system substrate-binding protein